ncbi:MAG: hypothetical protein VKK03_08115 [Synechococcus sp.]|nr:hypothetical protein [Synechococcus sp.]
MTQFERNQIRSRLHRLELDEQFVERYLAKLERNCECYAMACRTIDRWERPDPAATVAHALVCGLVAAAAGAWLALVG